MNNSNQKKTVLIIGGHDPSGGAGIQADIESVSHAGCQAVSVITALTTQNTKVVADIIPQEPEIFRKQIRLILEDIKIDACKLGMFGSAELVDIVNDELSGTSFPIILDPIIRSGSGTQLADKLVCEKIIKVLAPITTMLTPNSIEARALTQKDELEEAAKQIISYGTDAVLITGTHEKSDSKVINRLYLKNGNTHNYSWQRLPDTYHGSGCTLSSRIAARLALCDDLKSAVEEAQKYTWNTLNKGFRLGKGQLHPNRFFDQ